MLLNAQRGLEDMTGPDPSRRLTGLHNVAVFGRAVTIGLQRLRHITPGFDAWYQDRVPSGEKDPLLDYFNALRNAILKEALNPQMSTKLYIEHLSGSDFADILQGPAPEGATGLFIGEAGTGGSGWEVTLPDGTQAKYYAALSAGFKGQLTLHLPNAPNEFMGQPLTDTTASGIAGRYVSWLSEMVDDATIRFSQ